MPRCPRYGCIYFEKPAGVFMLLAGGPRVHEAVVVTPEMIDQWSAAQIGNRVTESKGATLGLMVYDFVWDCQNPIQFARDRC